MSSPPVRSRELPPRAPSCPGLRATQPNAPAGPSRWALYIETKKRRRWRAKFPQCRSGLPHRLHLDVPHPAQKNGFVLIFQGGERTAECILGPTLRIGLDRIIEEATKSCKQIRFQIRQTEFANQIRCLGHDEIVAMPQRAAQPFGTRLLRPLAKLIQSRELFFKAALSGHSWQFNRASDSCRGVSSSGSCRVSCREERQSFLEARGETQQSWQLEGSFESGAGTRCRRRRQRP